jgi:hypothetical protein
LPSWHGRQAIVAIQQIASDEFVEALVIEGHPAGGFAEEVPDWLKTAFIGHALGMR